MSEELPPGWAEINLEDVVSRPRSKVAPGDHPELPFVGMDHIAPNGMALLGSVQFGTMKSSGGLFLEGDVLYGRMRPYLNKVHRAKTKGACSAEFIVFPSSAAIDADFLAYLLHHRKFVNFATGLSSGDRPRVDFDDLAKYEFALPPRREQARIVSKIEELLSRIDEGERSLERVQQLVLRYRQSVITAAVTGELTRDWREQHADTIDSGEALLSRILKARRAAWEQAELAKMRTKRITPANDRWKDKYEEPAAPATTDLLKLPDGWVWASMQQSGEVRLGRQRAPQHHSGDHMRSYLRVANVYEDRLDLSDVMQMNFTPQEFETYELRFGDILLNEGQSPELVGRPAMFRGEIPNCCYQKTLIRFRAHHGIRPEFALLVFRAYLHTGRFRRSANITTSIAHLAAERFIKIEFPVPGQKEQAEIVEQVTQKLSVLAQLERELTAQRVAAEGLRQSVFGAAFAGEIVPQDPTDEPASLLLKRIAAEHSGATANAARRQRTLR